jgi:hypothetical protein
MRDTRIGRASSSIRAVSSANSASRKACFSSTVPSNARLIRISVKARILLVDVRPKDDEQLHP